MVEVEREVVVRAEEGVEAEVVVEEEGQSHRWHEAIARRDSRRA